MGKHSIHTLLFHWLHYGRAPGRMTWHCPKPRSLNAGLAKEWVKKQTNKQIQKWQTCSVIMGWYTLLGSPTGNHTLHSSRLNGIRGNHFKWKGRPRPHLFEQSFHWALEILTLQQHRTSCRIPPAFFQPLPYTWNPCVGEIAHLLIVRSSALYLEAGIVIYVCGKAADCDSYHCACAG